MKTNKGFALITLVAIIAGVLVVGGGAYLLGKNKGEEKKGIENNIVKEKQNDVINNINKNDDNEDVQKDNVTWLKSPKFGLYYQNNLNIIEYFVDKNGKEIPLAQSGLPTFVASFGKNQNTLITWGGGNDSSCMEQNDFGEFKYGVSSQFCLKGHHTWVSHVSAKDILSQDELNIFGDFILKNKY